MKTLLKFFGSIIDFIFDDLPLKVFLLFIVGILTFGVYTAYLENKEVKYTHNILVVENVIITTKLDCEKDDYHSMCYYRLSNGKNILLPTQLSDKYLNSFPLNISIKFSESRLEMYVSYNVGDIFNQLQYDEIATIVNYLPIYTYYCNSLKIQYCQTK